MAGATKKIGLLGLGGMVIGSCIGSGVFALTGQISQVAAPGTAIVAWLVVGAGFLLLALSLSALGEERPDIHGVFQYATEGWGPLAGFISGWGYWLSAWLGNVAFATILMSAVGYFYPPFVAGNTVPCIAIASVIMWLITFLVIRGVESASFLNAIVMLCKVASLTVFIVFALFLFNAGVFSADFWGTVYDNAVAAGKAGAGAVALGSVPQQIINCLIILMWTFVGVEGAVVMSSRAEKKSDVGKATVIGMVCLLLIYMGASVLPYGYLPYTEIAAMDKPAMLYVFEKMAPGWGGAFITVAMIVAVLGSWLSFTILPAETTSEMAEQKLLPVSWGTLNQKNSPQFSLLIVGACTQLFMITLIFTEDAYNVAFSMCTVAIVVTWAFAAAYHTKLSAEHGNMGGAIIGGIATAFQVIAVILNGWTFLLLCCAGYIPGFVVYALARREQGLSLSGGEKVAIGVISALGVLAIVLLAMGVITV